MGMTTTTQTLANKALATGCPQTEWTNKSWHHDTALERAAWQFPFSPPRSGGMRWAEDLLHKGSPGEEHVSKSDLQLDCKATLIHPCTHHPPSPVLRCTKHSSDPKRKALRTISALPFPGTLSLTFTEDGWFLPASTYAKALTVPGLKGWGETLLYTLQQQSTRSWADSSPQTPDTCGFSTERSKLCSQPRYLYPNQISFDTQCHLSAPGTSGGSQITPRACQVFVLLHCGWYQRQEFQRVQRRK